MSRQERLRERLDAIAAGNGGRLTPELVIADAKDPDSPLHDEFEWDVEKAAHRHWTERARELITEIKVRTVVEQTTVTSVYYVRDPRAGASEQGYISVDTLRSDEDLAREAVHAEFIRARQNLRRAQNLAAVLSISGEVLEVDEKVSRLIEKVRPSAAMQ